MYQHLPSPVNVILIGDSHADVVVTALQESSSAGVKAWTRGCPLLLDINLTYFHKKSEEIECLTLPRKLIDLYANKHELPGVPIILLTRSNKYISNEVAGEGRGNNNQKPLIYFKQKVDSSDNAEFQKDYINSVVRTACSFQQYRQVYLVRPIPEIGRDVPRILSRNLMFGNGKAEIKILLKDYHSRNELAWNAQDAAVEKCGVKILNPLPYLCDNEYCYATKNGRALYSDDDHLSEYGNKFLVPMFEEIFNDQETEVAK